MFYYVRSITFKYSPVVYGEEDIPLWSRPLKLACMANS